MLRFCGSLSLEASHGNVPWDQLTVYQGGRHGRGKTDHIHGVLPQGLENHLFTNSGVPSDGPQCQETAVTFHVLAIQVREVRVVEMEGGAAPM